MTPQAERFARMVNGPDDAINLAEAALLIAAEETRALDVDTYLARLDDMAATLKRRLRPDISQSDCVIALNRYLFDELGFAGDAANYYDARNSFLNEVIDRKRGIPITLALIYIEIGRRIGLPVEGITFPAHFLVKCPLRDGTVVLDPYAKGASLSFDELRRRVRALRNGEEPTRAALSAMLVAASNREILGRLLRNLKAIYSHHKEWMKALAATDRIISLMPESAEEYRDRAVIYLNLECFRAALFDFQAYLMMLPAARDADTVREKIAELQAVTSRLN